MHGVCRRRGVRLIWGGGLFLLQQPPEVLTVRITGILDVLTDLDNKKDRGGRGGLRAKNLRADCSFHSTRFNWIYNCHLTIFTKIKPVPQVSLKPFLQ